jgi:hypothetical protein
MAQHSHWQLAAGAGSEQLAPPDDVLQQHAVDLLQAIAQGTCPSAEAVPPMVTVLLSETISQTSASQQHPAWAGGPSSRTPRQQQQQGLSGSLVLRLLLHACCSSSDKAPLQVGSSAPPAVLPQPHYTHQHGTCSHLQL